MYQPSTNSPWFRCCENFCANVTGLLSKKWTFSTKVFAAPEPLRIGWWLIHQIEALILSYLWAIVGLQRSSGLCSRPSPRLPITFGKRPLLRPYWGWGRVSRYHPKAHDQAFQMVPFLLTWAEKYGAESQNKPNVFRGWLKSSIPTVVYKQNELHSIEFQQF